MPQKLTPRRHLPDSPRPVAGALAVVPPKLLPGWFVYVLRCGDGSLYCGITNDLSRRFAMHCAGKGARYTRGRAPLVLVQSWPVAGKSLALKAERWFKRHARAAKEKLVADRAGHWLSLVTPQCAVAAGQSLAGAS